MPKDLKLGLTAFLGLIAAGTGLAGDITDAGAADQAQVRQEFVAAMQRIRLHLPELPDSPALEAYAIHDYLTAARLRLGLQLRPGEEFDTTIDEFLRGHAGQPVTHGLRREWLESLAQRRRWDWFLPRASDAADPRLVCDRLQGLLETGNLQGLGADALTHWSQPQKQPGECAAVFAWLRQQGLLTPALAESRTRAALAADNPRLAVEFAADVPASRIAPLLQWAQLLQEPKSTLSTLVNSPTLPVEPDALAAGFNRLSTIDSAAALDLLPLLLARADMTPVLRERLQRSAALGAAYGHDPASVAAFGGLSSDAVDSQVEEWRVRAALWAGDFRKALDWIEQMPSGLATQPRWRYWRARATAETSGSEAAAPLFAEIAGMRDYYGYLAADRLHREYSLNARPSPDDAAAQAALAAEPGLIRADELFQCGLADEAAAEWGAALSSAESATKVQAGRLAARWGWYSQSIATLAQAGEWDDVRLRYPRPYQEAVAAASKTAQMPADWILAVMRQESLFRKDAVSRADARGLMQMLPATAVAVARRWHLPAPERRDGLFDPSVAVTLGAAYLRELLDRYGAQLSLSLAAYNAGPMPVARWLPREPMDADIWIENIPYTETRGYVQHVLEHVVAFAWVRDAEPPRLATLLPPVEPESAPALAHPSPASAAADQSRGDVDREAQNRRVE
jgi:soluble lytic murein transglycosylase